MAADVPGGLSNWHNESNPCDVNGDGRVTAVDALNVINAIGRYDDIAVEQIQDTLQQDSDATDLLLGRYHPDVDFSGTLTAVDALRVINQLSRISSLDGVEPVSVISDRQGKPLRILYSAADGRVKGVDVEDRSLTMNWSGNDLIATNSDDEIVISAKPGIGVLEVDLSGDDGLATVTRLESDGSTVTERYVCVPGTIWRDGEIIMELPPGEVRRPIEGFEEVIGSMVEQQTVDAEGKEIIRRYEEAAPWNLLSVTATLADGPGMTVITEGATLNPSTIILDPNGSGDPVLADLVAFEDDLLFLLQNGYQPFETVTPNEVYLALQTAGRL